MKARGGLIRGGAFAAAPEGRGNTTTAPEAALPMGGAYVPRDAVGTGPLSTRGVPLAGAAGDTAHAGSEQPVSGALLRCTAAGTLKAKRLGPGSSPIPPGSFNVNGLVLPATTILKELGKDGGGLV